MQSWRSVRTDQRYEGIHPGSRLPAPKKVRSDVSNDFRSDLRNRQARVEAALGRFLNQAADGCPPALAEAMSYSLLAPGKRLRPILALMGCRAAGGNDEQALPAACALEMVHTYSLIHDDLPAMDDDDLRRGLPTCHKKFGEALAILAGDSLLTLAFQVLADSYPAATAAVSCLELARGSGAAGMVGGQVLDLAAEGKISNGERPHSVGDLETIHRRKTGALFRSSLRLGLYAAQGERAGGPDRLLQERLDAFGKAFGLAFQIADDLLDVEGQSEAMGKRAGKDAARGKLTYPGLLGNEESRRRAELLCKEAARAVDGLGAAAEPLAALARYVMDRDR
jgi:geranylgeranyl diphosphate synthase, type II